MLRDDQYLTPKEISGHLHETYGIVVSRQYVRSLWAAGAPNIGRYGRVDELLEWWKRNPDVQPRARRQTTGSIREI